MYRFVFDMLRDYHHLEHTITVFLYKTPDNPYAAAVAYVLAARNCKKIICINLKGEWHDLSFGIAEIHYYEEYTLMTGTRGKLRLPFYNALEQKRVEICVHVSLLIVEPEDGADRFGISASEKLRGFLHEGDGTG